MMPEPLNVFISYDKQDFKLLTELEKHLALLQNQGLINTWGEHAISAGSVEKQEIEKRVNSADIILLLISPDFMATKHSNSVEMHHIMSRHESGEARVIPILLRSVYLEGAQFNTLYKLPDNAIPVTDGKWHNQDEAFTNITRGIRKAIEEIQNKRFPQQVQEKRLSVAQIELLISNPLAQLKKRWPEFSLQSRAHEHSSTLQSLSSPHSLFIYSGHSSPIQAIAWSPDCRYIASGDQNSTVHIWEASTGKTIFSITSWGLLPEKKRVQQIIWSPDSQYIAIHIQGKDSSRIFIWQIETQKSIHCTGYHYLPHSHTSCFAWSPDSSSIVMDDKRLYTKSRIGIWKIETGEQLANYTKHKHDIMTSISWSPTTAKIASGDVGGKVHIWDSSGQTNLIYYKEHVSTSNAKAVWFPDGKHIASSSDNGGIQIWRSNVGKEITTYPFTGPVHWIGCEGAYVAFSGSIPNPYFTVWDLKTGQILFSVPYQGLLSKEGRYFASIYADYSIQLQNSETGLVSYIYRDHKAKITTFAWSPNGDAIASGSLDHTIHVWSVKNSVA